MSIRQLETLLGYSRATVQRAVEDGRLHLVQYGVYAVGHTNLSKHGECLAAVLAVGPGSLQSYWTAGWLWGILNTSPRPFHVTAPGPRRLRDRDPVKVHRARNLVDADRAFREGIPVTSLARTLLDLAEVLKPERLAKALEQAEKSDRFDAREVVAVCLRSRGHKGSRRLLAALGAHRPRRHRVLRSDLERDFLLLLEGSDLPLPATNYFFGNTSWTPIGKTPASRSKSTASPPTAAAAPSKRTASGTPSCSRKESERSGSPNASSKLSPARCCAGSRRSWPRLPRHS